MIAAVCWIPKGVAKPLPEAAEPLSEQDIQALVRFHRDAGASSVDGSDDDKLGEHDEMQVETQTQDTAVATALAAARAVGCDGKSTSAQNNMDDVTDELAELDMENYDKEDEGIDLFGNGGFGAAYYLSNDMDPFLTNKDSEDEEEIEDMTIKPSDLLIVTARNEDDVSHLELWVYEEETDDGSDNMYVHHDVMLPAFPLSVAWFDCSLKGGETGNYVAVGTMQPEIEIWDLDILDAVEPAATLGGYQSKKGTREENKKKSKKKQQQKVERLKAGSHSDSVLGLAWNREFRNVLASASADSSVKIWDIVTQTCEHTISSHSDKVQAVAWNPQEATALLSGSFDHSVLLSDMRAPGHDGMKWSVSADVESLAWDPHAVHTFVVSLENGTVCGHDVRAVASKDFARPLFTLHAHDKAVCTIAYNAIAPHLLATGSLDKTVKLWDLKDNHPTCICSKRLKVGAVFACSFCQETPFLLAVGGSKGNLDVWNLLTVPEVMKRYKQFARNKVSSG